MKEVAAYRERGRLLGTVVFSVLLVLSGCSNATESKEPVMSDSAPRFSTEEEVEQLVLDALQDNPTSKIYNPRVFIRFNQKDCPVKTRFKGNLGALNGPDVVLPGVLPVASSIVGEIKWIGRQKVTQSGRSTWERFKLPYAVYFSPVPGGYFESNTNNGVVRSPALLEDRFLPENMNFKYSVVRMKEVGNEWVVQDPNDADYCAPLDPMIRILK